MGWLGYDTQAFETRVARRNYVRWLKEDLNYGSGLKICPFVSRLTLFVVVNGGLPTTWELGR